MKKFSHYIITRFNIKSDGWTTDKNGKNVNDDTWLKKRYALFETFCFPSVKAQSELDFEWLVFFDTETPEVFKDRNVELNKTFKNFTPLYVSNFNDFESKLRSYIHTHSKEDFVITTRLDNDDCIHQDFTKELQNAFVAKDHVIIEPILGLTLQIGKRHKLAIRETKSGPFVSLISKRNNSSNLSTIYDKEHTSWNEGSAFISIKKTYLWLQIIHDSNITNRLHNNLTFNKNLFKGFNFRYKVYFDYRYRLFVLKRLFRMSCYKDAFKEVFKIPR